MMKRYGKGWFRESHRHSMAARGMRSSYYAVIAPGHGIRPFTLGPRERVPPELRKYEKEFGSDVLKRDQIEEWKKKKNEQEEEFRKLQEAGVVAYKGGWENAPISIKLERKEVPGVKVSFIQVRPVRTKEDVVNEQERYPGLKARDEFEFNEWNEADEKEREESLRKMHEELRERRL